MSKIVSLESIPAVLSLVNRSNVKIVQCHGVFDCAHIGHLRYFQEAKNSGDILVVTVTSDRYVNKGKGRPIFNHDIRAEMIAAFEVVDLVVISDYPDAAIPINVIRPSIYAKGIDYADRGTSPIERDAVAKIGGKLLYTTTEKYSTTEILNRLNSCS